MPSVVVSAGRLSRRSPALAGLATVLFGLTAGPMPR